MSTRKHSWTAGFYWIGVTMALLYVALIVGGHTVFGYRLESARFPLMWPCAGIAIVAFIAAEVCNSSRDSAATGKPAKPSPPSHPQLGSAIKSPVVGH